MRKDAPEDFDIKTFFGNIYTFQGWELFPGHSTNGKNVAYTLDKLGVPTDLRGKRILDIAPWNGFFSFECVRRGASEVISLGPDDPAATGYNKTRDLLEIENCNYIRDSVYNLSDSAHGKFDIVLCLGLLYHLRHPLLALDKIYDVAVDKLYVDSPVIDNTVFDKTISPFEKNQIMEVSPIFNRLPLAYFTKSNETGDFYNWFMPNCLAFKDFVESSGFCISHFFNDSGWAYLAAVKGTRNFTLGIEGYNPGTINFKPNN
jgi:tRNA (mo5U34)-methyltransferase